MDTLRKQMHKKVMGVLQKFTFRKFVAKRLCHFYHCHRGNIRFIYKLLTSLDLLHWIELYLK